MNAIKYIASFLFCSLLAVSAAQAQFKTVTFNYELATFNENQPLPAESSLLFTGPAPRETDMVEIVVFKAERKSGGVPLATGVWKRPFNKSEGSFEVPLTYKLQASSEYDLVVRYYQTIPEAEKASLNDMLIRNLDAYLEQNIGIRKDEIELRKSTRQLMKELSTILTGGLKEYRFWSERRFDGFSGIVRDRLELLDGRELEVADSLKTSALGAEIEQLEQLLHREVQSLLNEKIVKLTDLRRVENYLTEDRRGYFSLSFGYGAAYLGGNINNLSYGDGPYVNIGFPLSSSQIAPKILRNSAFTLGFFLENFELENGNEVSGPVFGRPIQVGLDYKLFQFVRFNAGAALLEERQVNGQEDVGQRVFFEPFIGISAKINIHLSFDK
ncbi:MAG: hypothetical protein R3350_01200 [Saprospiraceae bacterium]|nr:hypothetical protein [Saprospiraceae bacterium]